MTQALRGFSDSRIRASLISDARILRATSAAASPVVAEGLALLRPIYWIAGAVVVAVALYLGKITAMATAIAALIALWAFIEPRTALWLATAFMVFLFVFFQTTAPLGEDLPQEFVFWGIGLSLITAGLALATLFSSQVDWALAKKRFLMPVSLAMFLMLGVTLAASVYGLLAGNQFSIVVRQLFGCVMLPLYYFLAVTLFRSSKDAARWMWRVGWIVALGSLWYVQKLLFTSAARGYYYREQSPLVVYAGAIGVVAISELAGRNRIALRFQAMAMLIACFLVIVLMGSRSALGSFFAAAVALAILLLSKRSLLLPSLLLCLVPVGIGVAPFAMTQVLAAPGLTGQIAARFIFALDEDASYQGRLTQTEVVIGMVNRQPILGAGMGSENSFVMPDGRRLKVASVDNGWGYLLLKMGYTGLAAFLLLVGLLLKQGLSGLRSARQAHQAYQAYQATIRADRLALVAAFFYALVTFLSGPTFFHLTTAPFFATALGALVVMGETPALAEAPSAEKRVSLENPAPVCEEKPEPCWS